MKVNHSTENSQNKLLKAKRASWKWSVIPKTKKIDCGVASVYSWVESGNIHHIKKLNIEQVSSKFAFLLKLYVFSK